MSEIFRFKGKHILYNTGEIQNSEPVRIEVGKKKNPLAAPPPTDTPREHPAETVTELAAEAAEELSPEQMAVVLGSMSDNRINDSVRDLVAQNA
ncbi:MAG: hypothetical protein IJ849_03490 [Selenomonadaceae bacterium]|nr:hypothetical protein [Selenomonadaceae bacterium]